MSQYDPYTWLSTALLVLWLVYRLLNPYKCECGYWSYLFSGFRKHVRAKHQPK